MPNLRAASQLWPVSPHQWLYLHRNNSPKEQSRSPLTSPLWWKGWTVPPQYHPQMMIFVAFQPQDYKKEKLKQKLANRQQKVLVCKETSYLPVASSLGGARMLPRHRSSTLRMPSLGIGTRSRAALSLLSPAASSSAQPRLYISIVYMKSIWAY